MAEVAAFKGVRFSPKLSDRISDLISPPYDVMSDSEMKRYAERYSANIIHLDLPVSAPTDFYARSRQLYQSWIANQTLVQDEAPALYTLEQSFFVGSERRKRFGILGSVSIQPSDGSAIVPHERTIEAPFLDRLNLLKATQVHYSPVFYVYKDPECRVETAFGALQNALEPLASFTDDFSITTTFSRIRDSRFLSTVQQALKGKSLLIADGHHRFRAQREFNSRGQSFGYLSNTAQEGFEIRPIHRALMLQELRIERSLQALTAHLNPAEVEITPVQPGETLDSLRPDRGELIVYHPDSGSACRLKDRRRRIETRFLEEVVFKGGLQLNSLTLPKGVIEYFQTDAVFQEMRRSSRDPLFLILPPLRFDEIYEACTDGSVLPQKSTYFFPKVPTGLVMMPVIG